MLLSTCMFTYTCICTHTCAMSWFEYGSYDWHVPPFCFFCLKQKCFHWERNSVEASRDSPLRHSILKPEGVQEAGSVLLIPATSARLRTVFRAFSPLELIGNLIFPVKSYLCHRSICSQHTQPELISPDSQQLGYSHLNREDGEQGPMFIIRVLSRECSLPPSWSEFLGFLLTQHIEPTSITCVFYSENRGAF